MKTNEAPTTTLTTPSNWGSRELWLGLTSTLCLWLPLALLQQVDAVLAYLPWRRLFADTALLACLLSVGTFVWWLCFLLITCVAGLRRKSAHPARLLLTGLYIAPFAFLCCWQIAFSGRHWLEVIFDERLAPAPWLRICIQAGGPGIALLVLWRWGPSQVFDGLLRGAQKARELAIALVVASAFVVGLFPPRLTHQTLPAAMPAAKVERTASDRPDIILITIDSLATKDAAPCGTGPTLMPALRQFAREGSCFTRFYAVSNFTTPTTSSIETGMLPWRHRAVQIGASVHDGVSRNALAQTLRQNGYRTLSVSANLLASPRHHGTYGGYDLEEIAPSTSLKTTVRGWFTTFKDSSLPFLVYSATSFLGTMDIYLNRRENPYDPMRVYRRGIDLLSGETNTSNRQPIFMWLHTLPPHAPYLPAAPFKYRLLPAGQLDTWPEFLADNLRYSPGQQGEVDRHHLRYKESIMAADQALGWLLDQLRAQGRWENTLIVISADHGESFEKGYMGHAGPDLHDALINIPLVIKMPHQRVGQVVTQLASQADLAPTLIALGQAKNQPKMEGRSLVSLLKGQPQEPTPVFAMSLERSSRFAPLTEGHVAVIQGPWKLIYDIRRRTSSLYNLAEDPGEVRDLRAAKPSEAERLIRMVQERLVLINQLPLPPR